MAEAYNARMRKLSFLLLAAGLICSCQQAQRPVIQTEVPIFTVKEISVKGKKKGKKRLVTESTLVTVSGPTSKEWDIFDRTDAVRKYTKMTIADKELLFGSIIRVYSILPKNNDFSSERINAGIWKEVTDQGVDLSFGTDTADWHPYLMYIHPIVISEMTNFFLEAREDNISDDELKQWQKALCNLINAGPDTTTAAAILVRKDALAKAGIIIDEENGVLSARKVKINWQKYRETQH